MSLIRNVRLKRLAIAIVLTLGYQNVAQAQSLDAGSFADIAIKSVLTSKATDHRQIRSALINQIGRLPSQFQSGVIAALVANGVKSSDAATKLEACYILGGLRTPWTTSNIEEDSQYIYKYLQALGDDGSRIPVDAALANIKGLYKDGITDFNSTDLDELKNSESKLKAMFTNYPKSSYAENAHFYLAQYFTKAFLLDDARGAPLLARSNQVYEDYIKEAEAGTYGKKTSFLAAAYYYRALNEWIKNDAAGSLVWLDKGSTKFTDDDQIYVYQLFVSKDPATALDKFFPGRSLFATTAAYLRKSPAPSFKQSGDLIKQLRQ